MAKYGNKKVIVDGIVFDSKKEAMRWKELCLLEKAGTIRNLQRQVPFLLIPTQRELDTVGKRGGVKKGKVIEREVSYVADFTYKLVKPTKGDEVYMTDAGWIVEDTKGMRTKDYIIKRKLMLYVYGIRIKEI